MSAEQPFALVASLYKRDAMCELFFTNLSERLPLRIAQYPREPIAAALASASALIVIRGLFEFGNLVECGRRLGVPAYYFLDDNFMLIRENPAKYGTLYERYTNDAVRDVLRQYEGVLLASQPLIDYFQAHRLHDRVTFYPPVATPPLRAPKQGAEPVTIAFFGGGHRREPFARFVYPAVRRVAEVRPLRLIGVGVDPADMPAAPGLEVITPPYNAGYAEAMRQVAAFDVDILVHPSDVSDTNIYKNPHVLVNAYAIGAVPVFTNAAPYDSLPELDPRLLTENSVDGWHGALSRLSGDAALRASLAQSVADICQSRFSGDANVEIINGILRTHPKPAGGSMARWLSASTCLGYGHARARLERRLRPKTT